MEEVAYFPSQEQARNAAVAWLIEHGGPWHNPEPFVANMDRSRLHGEHVGVEVPASGSAPWRRLRLDYDPTKGWHYNAEVGRGQAALRKAFCFPRPERRQACLDCDPQSDSDCEELLRDIEEESNAMRERDRGIRSGDAGEQGVTDYEAGRAALSTMLERYDRRCRGQSEGEGSSVLEEARRWVATRPPRLPNRFRLVPRGGGGGGFMMPGRLRTPRGATTMLPMQIVM